MNKLDATTAFARVEQWLIYGPFTSTYPTGIQLIAILFAFLIRLVRRVVHDIWLAHRDRGGLC